MNKEIRELLRVNPQLLEASPKDLKAIFHIMFRRKELVLCETNHGFRIQRLTYGDVYRRICQWAGALYAKIGATHQYVALEMENSPDWIAAFWAILMSGNKPYLVNTRYPEQLTGNILKTLGVAYILCGESSHLNGQVISVSDLSGDYPEVPEDVFEDEIAFSSTATSMNEVICFYSGFQIAEQIMNFRQIVKENPGIAGHYRGKLKQLAFLPFYHVFGLFAVYFWFTFFGRTIVFLRDYSAETILKTCRRHQVTHIFAVPLLWHTIEQKIRSGAEKQGDKKVRQLEKTLAFSTKLQNLFPKAGANIAKKLFRQVTDQVFGPSVMFCINGGSYVRDSAMELLNGIGYRLHNGFGMSEIGITSVELRHRPKDRNKNSIGHPFTSVCYRLDDQGILQVKGTSLCTKKIVNGKPVDLQEWFDTGDQMHCIDGHYYIHGRRSDTVIGENGENINPDMVEKAFSPENVQQFSVLGLPHEGSEVLCLVAQINPYTSEEKANRIRDYFYEVNATFPAATAVKKFYFTFDELVPPNAIKVSRAQLAAKIQSGEVQLTAFQQFQVCARDGSQRSPMLEQVCQIIASVLEIDAGNVNENSHIFYDLGATSIQYFSILSQLAETFSISEYRSTDTYRYTPKEICEYIERNM